MTKTILVTTGATETFVDLIKFAVSDTFLDYVACKGFSRLIIQYGNDQSIIEQRVGYGRGLVPLLNNDDNNSDKNKYRETLSPTCDERTTILANTRSKDHSYNNNQQQSSTIQEGQNYHIDDNNNNNNNNNNDNQKTLLKMFKHSRSSLIIESYAFNSNLLEDLASAQVVVSHSGTGSILDALRLKKPLLVVVNENLMDNHQLEIASMLQEMQLLVYFQFQAQNKQLEEQLLADSREYVNNYRILLGKLDQLVEGITKLQILPPPNSNALNDVINQELGYV